VHDNASSLGRPPRAVHYRIEGATATLTRSLEEPLVASSICCGSQRDVNGSSVVAWGGSPISTEFDVQGQPTFRLALDDGWFTYRTVPVTDELTRAQLRAGMDAQVAPKR
jgi:hypothetical protein